MDKSKQVKRSVISRKNLPARLPLWQTVVLILLYDRIPPENIWGQIAWGILLIILISTWALEMLSLVMEKEVDIFERFNIIIKKIALEDVNKAYSEVLKKHKGRVQ